MTVSALVATPSMDGKNTNASSAPRVAIFGRAGFKNQSLADRIVTRFAPLVPDEEADVLIVFWGGQPGLEKDKIAERAAAKRDVIAIKPDGTFTRMGFGNCLTK